MSLARTRRVVAASGVLIAIVAGVALWQVGGPGEARREARDERRHADLQAVAEAIACHVAQGAEPARPEGLAEIDPACLSPDRAAQLVDPGDGAAYSIGYPAAGSVRVCARFERAHALPRFAPAAFDPATGCLARTLPDA